ncbi:MAG: holo-ACP synthase, partial [Nitrospirae bacterium]
YCLNKAAPYPSLAGRFAAKESFIKALSTESPLRLTDIEVVRESRSGRPGIKLHGEAKRLFNRTVPGGFIHLSISHEREYAVSIVVIENGTYSAGLADQE